MLSGTLPPATRTGVFWAPVLTLYELRNAPPLVASANHSWLVVGSKLQSVTIPGDALSGVLVQAPVVGLILRNQ